MKRDAVFFIFGAVVGVLVFAGVAWADEATGSPWTTVPNIGSTNFSIIKPARILTLSNGGKSATINFEGDFVQYSGDLPVDDAAKVFFEAVMKQMRECK